MQTRAHRLKRNHARRENDEPSLCEHAEVLPIQTSESPAADVSTKVPDGLDAISLAYPCCCTSGSSFRTLLVSVSKTPSPAGAATRISCYPPGLRELSRSRKVGQALLKMGGFPKFHRFSFWRPFRNPERGVPFPSKGTTPWPGIPRRKAREGDAMALCLWKTSDKAA